MMIAVADTMATKLSFYPAGKCFTNVGMIHDLFTNERVAQHISDVKM